MPACAKSKRQRAAPSRMEDEEYALIVFTEDNVLEVLSTRSLSESKKGTLAKYTDGTYYPAAVLERNEDKEILLKKLCVLNKGKDKATKSKTSLGKAEIKGKKRKAEKTSDENEENATAQEKQQQKKAEEKLAKKKRAEEKEEKQKRRAMEKRALQERNAQILNDMREMEHIDIFEEDTIPMDTSSTGSPQSSPPTSPCRSQVWSPPESPVFTKSLQTSTGCAGCEAKDSRIRDLEKELHSYKKKATLTVEGEQQRPGRMSRESAANMVELSPGTQVFLYQHHLTCATKKKNDTGVACFLLSCFFTPDELIGAGTLGALDRVIIAAIVDFAVQAKNGRPAAVKQALRSKIQGLLHRAKSQ